jgi:tetratricopeptide (TPR) repeat protein
MQQPRDELMDRASRLERFVDQDPSNPTLLHDLATTYHLAGEQGLALAALERWHGLAIPALDALRGQILLASGRWRDAEHLFEAALINAPHSAALAFNLGYAVWASGEEPGRAATLFQRAAQLDGGNAGFHYHHAMALEADGNVAAAEVALAEALECEPNHLKSLAMLGQLKLDAGDFETASLHANRCIAAHPSIAAGWQLKGQVALFQMNVESAAKSLRQAMSLDSNDVDTCVSLAQASLMQGRVRHARELLDKALSRDGADEVALCMLGWACMADNDLPAAQSAFDQALAVAPDSADALSGAACLQLANGQPQAANDLAQRALLADEQHVVAMLITAQAHDASGHVQDARSVIESVLNNSPFGPLRANVGQTLQSAAVAKSAFRLQRRIRVATRTPNH